MLALADGTVFPGLSIGAPGETTGEVVFNTALTGYQEIITDPSYSRQIVTLTYPHIGNVGVNGQDAESDQIHAAGLVVTTLAKSNPAIPGKALANSKAFLPRATTSSPILPATIAPD